MPGGESLSLPSLAEVEHADWPSLKRMCEELGLNPKGRSGIVRMRVRDHVRRHERPEPWRASGGHLAPLLTRLGHPEAATRLWESAIRFEETAPWVGYGAARLAAGEFEEARKAYDRAAQMGDPAAHLHKAELLAARGDVLGAVQACDAYLAARPQDLRGLALRAAFLARGGSVDEAIDTLRRAAESHRDAPEAWRGLGRLLLKAGRAKEAVHALRAATQKDPSNVDGWADRGAALLLAGRPRDAIGAFRKALAIDPTRPDVLNNLGVAYLAIASVKKAVSSLTRAAKRLESPQILANLARAQEAAKKVDARKPLERPQRIPKKRLGTVARRRRAKRRMPAAKRPRRQPAKRPAKQPAKARKSRAKRSTPRPRRTPRRRKAPRRR